MIVTPAWQSQSWYPELLSFSDKSNHFAINWRLTKGSSKPTASSYPKLNNANSSVACLRKRFAEEGISERFQTLLSHQEEKVLSQLTHRPIISGLAVVLNKILIQFDVMWTGSWIFLPFCLSQDMNIGQYVHIAQQFQLCITILREDLLDSTLRSVLLLQVCSIIDHLSLNITLSGMFSWYWITWKNNFQTIAICQINFWPLQLQCYWLWRQHPE